jgi:pyruvate dehydrogenase E2 component (dihydrolipoamide acetyltransferase)
MFARELGVDLAKVRGTGPKQRITMDDVRGYVKGVIASSGAPAAAGDGAALGLIPWPKVDFADRAQAAFANQKTIRCEPAS